MVHWTGTLEGTLSGFIHSKGTQEGTLSGCIHWKGTLEGTLLGGLAEQCAGACGTVIASAVYMVTGLF